MAQRKIGYFVYDGVVLLEFAGPWQVFDVAGRVAIKLGLAEVHPFVPVVVSRTGRPIKTREGVTINAHSGIEGSGDFDLIIVPGGALQAELDEPAIQAWLKSAAAKAEVTASVCVGAFLLGKAGLLDGREATTHFEDIGELRSVAPKAKVSSDTLWVDEGPIVTSGGFAAGIDMALHLVSRLLGDDIATETARQLEYRQRRATERY
ncbi:DJ-1/PfpI family protein [Cupriavidus sp. 2SB]|uniref:DJ-1/PfpI family protein n=1 Tax=Cupriavidus sp. 2SB TaxID=2502199 RepID=UPI0010F7FBCD|nr:DJ-1/PfpI family protein [Cupriavidus sp. 2SB]